MIQHFHPREEEEEEEEEEDSNQRCPIRMNKLLGRN